MFDIISVAVRRLQRGFFRMLILPIITSFLLFSGNGHAQVPTAEDTIDLALEEAIQIALAENYTVRNSELNVASADAQIEQAWGQVMPQINFTSSYQRNVVTSNPFAGSSASSLFGSLAYIDWLKFNEVARADTDPATDPIALQEFNRRRLEGYRTAGIQFGGGGNPFSVANQFLGGISISQTIYDDRAFSAISGAQQLKDVNRLGLKRQKQQVVHNVRTTYYDVLLAAAQARVLEESVQRAAQTVKETKKRVQAGVVSKYQRLSAQVRKANLETQLIEARNQVDAAKNQLKYILGLAVTRPVALQGTLEITRKLSLEDITVSEIMPTAIQQRPDLEKADAAVALERVQKDVISSEFFPTVNVFANLNYSGRVPADRTYIIDDPDDPFSFSTGQRGFFGSSYWNPSLAVGLQLSWNIFDGFQRSARLQQAQIAVQRAQLQKEQLRETIRLEVEQALQNLRAARKRIESQQQNLERAELNYEFAVTRLNEGVGIPLEVREASEQLDQSRLSYLQAVHDYLIAKSAFELATGMVSPTAPTLELVPKQP